MAAITVLPERRTWTRTEFERAWKQGVFGPEERLELIEGEIFTKMVQDSQHSAAIGAVQEAIGRIFVEGYWIRIQLPLAVNDRNLPEPDIAVVVGSWRDYRAEQPTTAVLVVEVAGSSLAYDRETKASLYSQAGVVEYWIVNLVDRVLEVYRQPIPITERPPDHYYRSITHHAATETISPLAAPNHPLAVADLLP